MSHRLSRRYHFRCLLLFVRCIYRLAVFQYSVLPSWEIQLSTKIILIENCRFCTRNLSFSCDIRLDICTLLSHRLSISHASEPLLHSPLLVKVMLSAVTCPSRRFCVCHGGSAPTASVRFWSHGILPVRSPFHLLYCHLDPLLPRLAARSLQTCCQGQKLWTALLRLLLVSKSEVVACFTARWSCPAYSEVKLCTSVCL